MVLPQSGLAGCLVASVLALFVTAATSALSMVQMDMVLTRHGAEGGERAPVAAVEAEPVCATPDCDDDWDASLSLLQTDMVLTPDFGDRVVPLVLDEELEEDFGMASFSLLQQDLRLVYAPVEP